MMSGPTRQSTKVEEQKFKEARVVNPKSLRVDLMIMIGRYVWINIARMTWLVKPCAY